MGERCDNLGKRMDGIESELREIRKLVQNYGGVSERLARLEGEVSGMKEAIKGKPGLNPDYGFDRS